MARLLRLIATLILGALLGLGAAWIAAGGQPLFGSVRSGAWVAWPSSGTADIDPYAKAVFSRDGRIPEAAANALTFLAIADDKGAALSAGCDYEISGPTVQAQYWTITPLDPSGFVHASAGQRLGFTSQEVVRDASGTFVIVLAKAARPGNWLPAPGDGRFSLMLTFYDTPLTTALLSGAGAPALPSIVRRACR